jgi:RecB family exonuclease
MIKQWSYSRLSTFEKCPKQAEYKFIKRIKEPSSPAMNRGRDIHKLCEEFIRGALDETPPQLKEFEEAFLALKDLYLHGHVICESDWAITSDWEKTGWFEDDTWGRAKVDAFVYEEGTSKEARVIDFKTGRYDGNQEVHKEQCELYGAIALKRYPELESITTEMWYLDHGKIDRYIYTPESIKVKQEKINQRAITMTTTTEFPANPSKFKCKWCYFGKERMCKEGAYY